MDEGKTIQHKTSENHREWVQRNEDYAVILERIVCLVKR